MMLGVVTCRVDGAEEEWVVVVRVGEGNVVEVRGRAEIVMLGMERTRRLGQGLWMVWFLRVKEVLERATLPEQVEAGEGTCEVLKREVGCFAAAIDLVFVWAAVGMKEGQVV